MLIAASASWAATCKVTPDRAPSEAEAIFQQGDHAKAETMLKDDLAKTPNDPDKTALLVRALLWQWKTDEASKVLDSALAAHPDSATLLTEKGELLYREGKPWDVGAVIAAALKADPCFPRAYRIYSWLKGAESNRATMRKSILIAHQLDPNDPELRDAWINTLPLSERIQTIEADVASGKITDKKQLEARQKYLDSLKKFAAEPPKACTLVSHEQTAEVPMLAILGQQWGGAMHGSLVANSYGLGVKINGHDSTLQIDTGASGLAITRSVAEHAGLKFSEATKIGGIGDEGPQNAHLAYADSIQIGGLEFKDCAITVFDKVPGEQWQRPTSANTDGLIGTDVFESYLVTLDYPMHKMDLQQLPARPNQQLESAPRLATSDTGVPEDQPAAGSTAQGKAASQPVYYDRYIAPEMKDYVPIYRVGHNLLVPGTLHKPDVELFVIDTGSWATTVSADAARAVTKVDVNLNTQIFGLSGKVEKPSVAEALDINFGGISKRLLGVPVVPMNGISQGVGMNVSGFIGADILPDLTIHIDYRDGLVKFDYDPKRGYHPLNRDTAF